MTRLVQIGGTLGWLLAATWFHASVLAPITYDPFGTSRFGWTCAYGVCLVLASYAGGLPDLPRTRRGATAVAGVACAASVLAISVAQLLVGQALLPRAVALGSLIVIVPWNVLCAGLLIDRRDRSLARDRVVVVGSWADAADLSAELETGSERSAIIVDVLQPEVAAADAQGTLPLIDSVTAGAATVVVLDRVAQNDRTIVEQAAALHERGVRVRTLSLFYEEWLGKLPISELERVSLMFDIGEVHRIRYGRLKRGADVAVGVVGCILLLTVLPFVAVGNLLGNRGPLLFRQQRVGKNGAPIVIVKFRTMTDVADASHDWTEHDDPRITRFGNVLRRTHLDELPQMINILRGDLSLVGPRPEQTRYVEELREKLPFYNVRHLVRPGLTGWAQVKFGYASSDADALEKLQYEIYYLRHQSISFDLRIVARTVRRVLRGAGR